MSVLFTQVSTKGQVVIPAELRQEMGIESGTQVAVERQGDMILLRPITPDFIRGLRGSTKGSGRVREREHRKDRL
jgi:AbrB family looped-hinge helix DNA binding protein